MPSLHEFKRSRRGLPFQFVHIHVQTILRNGADQAIGMRQGISSVVLQEEQRYKPAGYRCYSINGPSLRPSPPGSPRTAHPPRRRMFRMGEHVKFAIPDG